MRSLTVEEREAFNRAGKGDLQPFRDLLERNPGFALLCDEYGRTPLHDAASFGDIELSRRLVEAGCPLEPLEEGRLAPLHCAALGKKVESLDFLLTQGASVDRLDQNGCTALHHLIYRSPWFGDMEVTDEDLVLIRLLLQRGANPNLPAPARRVGYDGSCFEMAVLRKSLELAELLLDWGAEGDLFKHNGPLVAALLYRRPALRTLALPKASPSLVWDAYRYPEGHLPIHRAVVEQDLPGLQSGVTGGWQVDSPNRSGRSALHLAALLGQKAAAGFLLEHGADAMLVPPGGEMPSELARETGQPEIVKLLDPVQQLKRAVSEDDVETIERMLDRQPHLLTWGRPGSGSTLLHLASEREALGVARLLLARGADPDQQDDEGNSALHFVGSNAEMAGLLLEHGAQVNLPARDQSLPIRFARGQARQLLLARGADPADLRRVFCDALSFAICHTGHLNGWEQTNDAVVFEFSCVKLLLRGGAPWLRVRLENLIEVPAQPFPQSTWLRLGAMQFRVGPNAEVSMHGFGRYVAEKLILEDGGGVFSLEAVETRHEGWVEAWHKGELGDDPAARLS